MTWMSDLAKGAAQYLDDQGVGLYAPDSYMEDLTSADKPIVVGALMDRPDVQVGISVYRLGADDPQNPTSTVNLQFRIRGATLDDVSDLDQGIYDVLQGLKGHDFGSCHVTQVVSGSSLPMGIDPSGRPERASNYSLDVDLPATALRSY